MSQEELIQELQKTKEDLDDLSRYFEEFFNFLPLAFCTVNPIGVIIDTNQAFQKLVGYNTIEVIGKKIRDLFLESKELEVLFEEAQKNEAPIKKNITLISKDKKKIPVEIVVAKRKDREGNFIGYFFTITDITEFKTLQQELEEKVKKRTEELEKIAEERTISLIKTKALAEDTKRKSIRLEEKTKELENSRKALINILEDINEARKETEEERDKTQAIITNLADGLLFFDHEKKLSLVNPQAENLLKIKASEAIGKSILEIAKIANFKPLINIIGTEIKKVFREELKITENFILEVSTVSITSRDKEIGTLVILHDVSREKLVERMKTELVSIAAHQLRTPLSAIKWSISLLKDYVKGEEAEDLLGKLNESNERMINLIDDLLNVSRIEEGRYIYKPDFKDFIQITEAIIEPRIETAERKGLNFYFKKPTGLIPKVKVDEEKISLCIQNLVENAINYTPKGGKVEAKIEYDENKKEIIFSVKDTGIGIPEDQKNRIFTRFFRAENAIRSETEGTGLGLFITKNIVEAHGGKIWFESKEGKGTTFYFSLPTE